MAENRRQIYPMFTDTLLADLKLVKIVPSLTKCPHNVIGRYLNI